MKSLYFTHEHDIFRKTVRQFIQSEVVPHVDKWEEERRIPREIWSRMGELGFLGIDVPEAYGGAGADFFQTVVFLEELARCTAAGFAAAVSVHCYMATAHLMRTGSEELKEKYLRPAVEGRKIGALAVTEPDAGSDVAAIRTKAVRDGDSYVINGTKTFITNGVYCDFATVAVKTRPDAGVGGISLIVVDRDTPGFKSNKLKKMGWHCSDTGELSFEDVRVPAGNRIGDENRGFYYIMESFQLERLVGAILSVAGAQHGLEMTLQYVGERKAFGRPIGKFQIIRHTLAQLAAEIEAARQLTYHTCWLHGSGQHAVRECSMAKLVASELAKKSADECLQFFGGYGYMDEYPISRMYRDARVGTIGAGTSEILREIIARMTIDEVRYDSVYGREEPAGGESGGEASPTAAEILGSLPRRFRPEKASGVAAVFHFDLSGPGGGRFTVTVNEGACSVAEGLQGEPGCLIESDDRTYADIELGRADPQAAFLSGKIKVSDIGEMMTFTRLFKRFPG